MAKSSGKSKLRRSQVRRQRSESTQPIGKRLRDVGLARPAIGIGFVVLATQIVLYGLEPFPYHLKQEIQRPLFARVEFGVTNEQETLRRRQEAREGSPNYYTLDTALIERINGVISSLYTTAQAYESFEAYEAARAEVSEQDQKDYRWQLDRESFGYLHSLAGESGQRQFAEFLEQLIDNLKRERLVQIDDEQGRDPPSRSKIAILIGALPNENDTVLENPNEVQVGKYSLAKFNATNLRNLNISIDTVTKSAEPALRPLLKQVLISLLRTQPLFNFDLERTLDEMENAAKSRGGDILEMVYPNYVLAQSPQEPELGSRYYLNEKQVELLQHEYGQVNHLLSAPLDQLEEKEVPVAKALRHDRHYKQVALGALVVLMILGMVVYCGMFQPRVIHNPMRALSIAVLFLVMMAACRIAHLTGWIVTYPYVVVAPVVMTGAILTMVYSQRFALAMTAALAVLITLTVRGDLAMLLVLVACMAVAVYQLREIRSRNELVSTGVLNTLTAFIMGMVAWLSKGYSLESAVPQAIVAATSALTAIAIFFLILQPIEKIFKVATNWTLLELLDTSNRLLSRLAREAPGTFAHSLWLSSMAEAACDAIDANGLLAKVGAMYHDIGKVHKAEYFAENQEANINRHENLAPTMSLLVIIGHVKDGVELAKEEGLPTAVIRFIAEHHGTTLVRYFHHVASEQQRAAGNTRGVSESEFRYPGPKPQSKETAVLMLCDGVEGAVRSLQEPTAGRIETVVHNVLMDRLNDGQFDDCDITLKELHLVEDSLVKTLCRFYHGRVAYPKAEQPREAEPSQPVGT